MTIVSVSAIAIKNTHKYYDDDEMWEKSQRMLKAAMDDLGLEYFEAEGEAAFYGPKLDVQTKTALGGEETLSTIQLDFLLPERFDLKYVGADGEEHRPVMIHRGIVSTMERFTAYLTEMYKGAFPTWLAPKQVEVIPVNLDLHTDYARKLASALAARQIRVSVDDRNEKMGYKIRQAQVNKVPYTLVVGDNEKSREQSRFVVMVKKRPKRWHLMISRRFWITILKHIAAMKIKKSFKQLTILNRTVKI